MSHVSSIQSVCVCITACMLVVRSGWFLACLMNVLSLFYNRCFLQTLGWLQVAVMGQIASMLWQFVSLESARFQVVGRPMPVTVAPVATTCFQLPSFCLECNACPACFWALLSPTLPPTVCLSYRLCLVWVM
jgi:hypothetical protein